MKPTIQHARKVLTAVDFGLVAGLGVQEPGKMCVEAAVCSAFDMPHSDKPPCVGEAVRAFKIALNDSPWSTDEARGKGMRKLAIAQLGSDTLDQMSFGKEVYLRGVKKLLPFVFRKSIPKVEEKYRAGMLELVETMEQVITFEDAQAASKKASASAYASDYASAYASASDYASAYASAYAYASDYASASASAYAYASDYASAYAYAFFKENLNDEFLLMVADVGCDVLKEMKSPGCKWLFLCAEKEASK